MSNHNFVKGECQHCAGHLEFPADAAGETIVCPHCGQTTELAATVLPNKINGSRRMWLAAAVLGLVLLGGLTAMFFQMKHAGSSASSQIKVVPAVVQSQPPVGERTNDFAIAVIKLEKTPGNSLVHVTANIQNLSEHQRFGVKVEFELFDANGNPVGTATDYQPVLEPRGDWRCKALVMDAKATSAKFNSIHEDPQ
jgi:uncharacterized OB-fold protein